MNIQNNKSNVNFGWSCETHRQIIATAIKDLPEYKKYQKDLEYYVQRPDHDDIGFLANKHFYFGKKMNKDVFELAFLSVPVVLTEKSKYEYILSILNGIEIKKVLL